MSTNGALVPVPTTNPDTVWRSNLYAQTGYEAAPIDSTDLAFRQLHEQLGSAAGAQSVLPSFDAVGQFDPGKLPGFSALAQVPLETYYPPQAVGADAPSRQALGNKPLLPNANIAGYLQAAPLMLTTLSSLPAFEQGFSGANAAAPISVVRVKVANLHGSVEQQLARVAQVANAIRQATGLDVDVTAGSSPTTETINLPAGTYGRPAVTVDESWVREGVALVILLAVDRKSVALFLLILVVTVFFLANGTLAAVRARRSEIGVLRCLGWPRRAFLTTILGEVVITGALAGVAGTVLSALFIASLRLQLPLWRVALITPVAIGVAGVAGVAPAWLASRGQPLDALAPAIAGGPARARPVRHLAGLAFSNLRRMPSRTMLAAAALALGIAALSVLLAINFAFANGVAGSAMGTFVITEVRGVDYFSAALAIALGAASVADVLYINLRERAPELALLAATGWSRRHLIRVAVYEGTGIGLIGSLAGALFALTVIAVGGGVGGVLLAAIIAAAAGMLLTLTATATIAVLVNRRPVVSALAED